MPQSAGQIGKSEIYRPQRDSVFCRLTPSISYALTKQQPELTAQVAHALLMPGYFSYRLTD